MTAPLRSAESERFGAPKDWRRRRITFVTPYYDPYVGGLETASQQMAQSLTRLGWEVDVQTSWWVGRGRHNGVRDDGPPLVERHRSPKDMVAFCPHVRGDVVHLHGFNRVLAAATVLAAKSRVLVLQPHGNLYTIEGENRSLSRSLRMRLDGSMSPWLLRRFDRILCLKDEERHHITRLGVADERCSLLPVPVAAAFVELQSGAKDVGLVVHVGRVLRHKYVEHAVAAIAKVSGARLVIIGPLLDERYEAELRGLVEDLGVGTRVQITGALSAAEVQGWLRRAQALVLCSKTEGQGLVVSEALLQGTIPIGSTTAVGALLVEAGGGLAYDWGDVDGLAMNISRAIRVPNDERTLAAARAHVMRLHGPDEVAARLGEIYNTLLAQRSRK